EGRVRRRGIDPADRMVEDDATEYAEVGELLLDVVCPADGALVMALDHHRSQPAVAREPHDLGVVRKPGEEVRIRMAVQVDRSGYVDQGSVHPAFTPPVTGSAVVAPGPDSRIRSASSSSPVGGATSATGSEMRSSNPVLSRISSTVTPG